MLVLFSGVMIVPGARGQANAGVIPGVYDGSLKCTSGSTVQHEVKFKLSLTSGADDQMTGTITFDAQDDSGTHPVTYNVAARGAADRQGGWVVVNPVKWGAPAPARHMIMTVSGALDVNSWFGLNGRHDGVDTISGIETGIVTNLDCKFSVKRIKTGTARSDPRVAAQIAGSGGPAQAAPGNASYCYCSAYFGPNGAENLAFSAVFAVPQDRDARGVRDDFVRFVREKYSARDANGGCSLTSTRAETESDKAAEAHRMNRKKMIETGWELKDLPPRVLRGP